MLFDYLEGQKNKFTNALSSTYLITLILENNQYFSHIPEPVFSRNLIIRLATIYTKKEVKSNKVNKQYYFRKKKKKKPKAVP